MPRFPFTSPDTPRRRVRVASASTVNARTATHQRRGNVRWQQRALEFSHRIPEADYATTFFGGGMSKLEFPIQRRDTNGEWVIVDDPGDVAVQAWDQVQDPGGGRVQIARNYGELIFTTGEGYLAQTWDADAQVPVWEFLSIVELQPVAGQVGQFVRQDSHSGVEKEELHAPAGDNSPVTGPGEIIAYRMWRPRRDRSADAWSPMGAVEDVCSELLDLTLAARAASRSRIARSQILFLPAGMSEANEIGTIGADDLDADPSNPIPPDDPDSSTLVDRFYDHAIEPVNNPASTSNLVPYVIEGWDPENGHPSNYLLRLYDPAEAYTEIAKRDEAVKRFARGVSLPLEVIMGMGAANHWSAWMVDDQTWQAHLQPEALRMVNDFTRVYLWPTLVARGVSRANAMDYRVWYEESGLVVNPDRSKDAFQAHQQRAISDKALRREIHFNDDDAPAPDQPNSFPVRGQGIDTGGPVPPEPTATTDTTGQPPAGDGQDSTQASGLPAVAAEVWLDGAQAVAVERCRELAGSRLRARLRDRAPDVPNVDLASVVGEQTMEKLGLSPLALVSGGAASLDRLLGRYGWAEDARRQACTWVEAYAAKTLAEATPGGIDDGAA